MTNDEFMKLLESHVRNRWGSWKELYKVEWAEWWSFVAPQEKPISEEEQVWQMVVPITFHAATHHEQTKQSVCDEWFYKSAEHPDGESWESYSANELDQEW